MDKRQFIFRKAAVDRLSAPDELAEALSITRPSDWLTLTALALIMTVALLWAVVARVQITTPATGILESADGSLRARLFVSEVTRDPIRPGLQVHLTSPALPPQQYGFITGVVTAHAADPMNDDELRRALRIEALSALCIERNWRVPVEVRIAAPAADFQMRLKPGTAIEGKIVLGEERPLATVFPWLKNFWRTDN